MKPVFEHAPLFAFTPAVRFSNFLPKRSFLDAAACLAIGLAGVAPDPTLARGMVPPSLPWLPSHAAPVIRVQANDEQRDFIKTVQRHLQTLGLYRGAIDGIAGPGTWGAIRKFYDIAGITGSTGSFGADEYEILKRADRLQAAQTMRPVTAIRHAADPRVVEAERAAQQGAQAYNNREYAVAEARLSKALDRLEQLLGPKHPDTLKVRGSLALTIGDQGRYAEEEKLLRENVDDWQQLHGNTHLKTLSAKNNLAINLVNQGRFDEAELLHRETFAARKRSIGEDHPDTLVSLSNLAVAINSQGRHSEAEALNRDLLAKRKKVLGANHRDTLATMHNLATSLNSQGRHSEALTLFREVLPARQKILGRNHPHTQQTMNNIAAALSWTGRHERAERIYKEIYENRKSFLGASHPKTLRMRYNIGVSYFNQSRFSRAESILSKVVDDLVAIIGPSHPETLRARQYLLYAAFQQGNFDYAANLVHRMFKSIPSVIKLSGDVPIDLTTLLRGASNQADNPGIDLAARTFPAQGYLTYGTLDVALGAQAARRQVQDDAAAKVLRAFQDAREELQRLRRAYLASFEQDSDVTEAARARIQAEMRAARARFDEVGDRMERDFPALAELEFPRALEAEEAQALLAPGEGMLAYASTEAHLYVWLVTRDGIEWRRMDAPRADLAERVDHLRASLDIDWSAPPPDVAPGCKLVSARAALADWPFDLCAAEAMQQTLLGDLDLSGIEELIVVPDGPLESLPFAMLVTDRAEDGRPRWLIEDHAITTLPTTSSLRALRRSGGTQDVGERQPYLGLAPVEFDAANPDSALRGSPLAALPASGDEVRLLSGLLGAGRDGTVIGPDASEAFAKSAPLDRYRVLSFATHGLLSRQAARVTDGDISEMSLALRPGDGEDGMLTASEVAGLRLDAEWVLLSACNTAGGDGDDARGLSGLARAFFFAGARALMVSHWNIDDAATSQLMADTMERSVTDDAISRAQALRQAQLAMLGQSDHAHPFYWAPFALVGENRRSTGQGE